MLRTLTAIGAAAILLGGPARSDAATVNDYHVVVEASVHYHHTAKPPIGSAEINEGYTLEIDLPKVNFRDGVVQISEPGTTDLSNIDSNALFVSNYGSGQCTGTTAHASLAKPYIRPGTGAGARVVVSPFGAISFPWACTGPPTPSGLTLVNTADTTTGLGPFDIDFSIPPEATAQGKIIQQISRDVSGPQCPLFSPSTVECTVHVQGVATFVRTGQHTEPDTNPPGA